MLLGHHGVGAGGQRRSRHDLDRRAGRQLAVHGLAGGQAVHHAEARARACRVGGTEGEAVHHGPVEGGDVVAGTHVGRHGIAAGLQQRDLDGCAGLALLQDDAFGLFDGEHGDLFPAVSPRW